MFFIYGLKEPGTDSCRYIGLTNNPLSRYYQHIANSHNRELRTWVDKLLQRSSEPEIIFLHTEIETEEEARQLEQEAILKYTNLGWPLFNRNGGAKEQYTTYLSPGQKDKLDDLAYEFKRETKRKISPHDIIRYLVEQTDLNTLLMGMQNE